MALVHEWVSARAGSEQVYEALAQLHPHADLFALSADPAVEIDVGNREVRTTLLDRPGLRDRRGLTLPLMPAAWKLLGKGDYDLVLTSHHAFAASNRLAREGAPHLAYVHTPARYVWDPALDGRATSRWLAPARKVLSSIDYRAASQLSSIAANSAAVADRIRRHWDREACVIHPPVDTGYFSQPASHRMELPSQFVLGLGRWIPYKNHHLIIDVAERVGSPVVIAGSGPLAADLRARARRATVPALIIERPSRSEVRELYRRADALLFPTEEDFGIVPVEAMAAGTPVVAYAKGGALETIEDAVSGALVHEHSVDAYVEGLRRVQTVEAEDCRARADAFGSGRFADRIQRWVASSTGAAPSADSGG